VVNWSRHYNQLLQKNNSCQLVLDNVAFPCYNGTIEIDKGIEMSAMKEYTLEIYKTDRRTKEGRRLYAKQDFAPVTKDYINAVVTAKIKLGFVVELYETFVTKTNVISGKEFTERYDTPYYCSPSSESYWSM
jgi:hypothetical protein